MAGWSASACVSNAGSEATVWSISVGGRRLLLCKYNSGELCDEYPLKG